MSGETILHSDYVYRGRVVNLRVEQVLLPGTREPFTREIVEHRPAVAMVALDASGNVYLVRQHRAGAGAPIWEVPAGVLQPGEDVVAGAQRELQEEIGHRAAHWEVLGSIYTSPGFLTEVIHLLLATGLTPARLPGDVDEDIAIELLPLDAALERVNRSGIEDAKTVIALTRARDRIATAGRAAPGVEV